MEKKDIEYFREFLKNRLEELLDHAEDIVRHSTFARKKVSSSGVFPSKSLPQFSNSHSRGYLMEKHLKMCMPCS